MLFVIKSNLNSNAYCVAFGISNLACSKLNKNSVYVALYRLTVSLRVSEVTRRAARALNNEKTIVLTVRSIAENIAESIAFTYIHVDETYAHNSEVNVRRQWYHTILWQS